MSVHVKVPIINELKFKTREKLEFPPNLFHDALNPLGECREIIPESIQAQHRLSILLL